VHLKMTGQLIYRYDHKTVAGGHNLPKDLGPLPNKFTHLIFSFADKSKLFYNDMRKFGYMKIVDQAGKEDVLANFGIDAMDEQFTFPVFKKILEKKKGAMAKAVLLDQMTMAGIGNIYADEACHFARILPDRHIGSLSSRERRRLYRGLRHVLALAIRHKGTSADAYVRTSGEKGRMLPFLSVYGRDGQRCRRCRGTIKKAILAARGTHFCPRCQR